MYQKGDLQQTKPLCKDANPRSHGRCFECFETHAVLDSRSESGVDEGRGAYLPHSCDDWVIGGPEEVQSLIDDLQAWMRNNNSESP
jgi:hypothetical protein